jgi:hypothetical protein
MPNRAEPGKRCPPVVPIRTHARAVFFVGAGRPSGAGCRARSTNWYSLQPSRGAREARLTERSAPRSGVSANASVAFPRRKNRSLGIFSSPLAGREGNRCHGAAKPEHVICSHVQICLETLVSLGYSRIIRWSIKTGYHQGNETMANSVQTTTADLFGHVAADPLPTRRARTTNDPLSRNSQATARGRRIADLFRSYMQAMADRSCFAQADALAAAELTVDAEDVRARRAVGTADIDEVVKAERLARHAVRKLKLDRQAAQPKKTFADRLRENAAARAAGS